MNITFCVYALFTMIFAKKLYDKATMSNENFYNMDCFDKFVYLCNNMQQDLSKYLSDAMSIRNQFVFRN